MNYINAINVVIHNYFDLNQSVDSIPAKDMMPNFMQAGIFEKDIKKGLPIRKVLRALDRKNELHLIPAAYGVKKLKNTNWFFGRNNNIHYSISITQSQIKVKNINIKHSKKDSDEHYIIDLLDKILGVKGTRQQTFDFLKGDENDKGKRRKLPIDVFYKELNLAIEFQEQQHTRSVKHFDKPDKLTLSGVNRGEQRKLYDHRKKVTLPRNGIKLIVISYNQFECSSNNKLMRNVLKDMQTLRNILSTYLK